MQQIDGRMVGQIKSCGKLFQTAIALYIVEQRLRNIVYTTLDLRV